MLALFFLNSLQNFSLEINKVGYIRLYNEKMVHFANILCIMFVWVTNSGQSNIVLTLIFLSISFQLLPLSPSLLWHEGAAGT